MARQSGGLEEIGWANFALFAVGTKFCPSYLLYLHICALISSLGFTLYISNTIILLWCIIFSVNRVGRENLNHLLVSSVISIKL